MGKPLLDAEELTFYAITSRYPGTEEEVTSDESLRAINLSARVRESVRKALAEEGLDIDEINI